LKKLEKPALIVALVLVLFCVISFAVLFFTDFWVAPIKSTAAVSAAARDLIPLDARFPFKPPEGKGIPAERLEPYLAVSCRTKASADRMEAYIEGEHGPSRMFGQMVYTEESGKLMIAYLKDLAAALPEAQMGPEEFSWINLRLRLIRKGQPSEHKREEMGRELEELRKTSENPQLDERTRKDLKRQIGFLETLPEAWGPASQADWALYEANAERIKACRNDGRVVTAMQQLLSGALGDKNRTAVEINPEEAPPPPDAPLPPPAPKN
jgi:hypothetical protein